MVRGKKKNNNNDSRIPRVSDRNHNTISSSMTSNRALIQSTLSQQPNTIPLNQQNTSTNRNTTVNEIVRDSSDEETHIVRNPTRAKRLAENEIIKESFKITGIILMLILYK